MSPFDSMFHLAAAPVLRQVFSVLVSLLRPGAAPTEDVPAQPRKRPQENQTEETFDQQIELRDYVIDAADYVFAGSPVTPREGDRIVETINGTSCTFEVLPHGALPGVEPEDPSGKRWLIRTKRVG